jgi:hypothetical protein
MSIPNHRRQEPPRRAAHPGDTSKDDPRTKDDPAAPKPGKGRTPSASAAASTTLEKEG